MGPFTRFMTGDTMGWFEDRGVALKIEDDGRVFPQSDSSQSIIDCLLGETKRLEIRLKQQEQVQDFYISNEKWNVKTKNAEYPCDALLLSAGSSHAIWKKLAGLGHTIVDPVPSLFTFNIKDKRIKSLQGLSVEMAQVSVNGSKLKSEGPVLITHWGLSGPAILKLSAWGAREFAALDYEFQIQINWTGTLKTSQCLRSAK